MLVGILPSSKSEEESPSSSCNMEGYNGEASDPDPVEDSCSKELSTMDLLNIEPSISFQREGNGIMFSVFAKTNITITDIEFAKASRGVGPVEIVTEVYTSTTRPNYHDLQNYQFNTSVWTLFAASKVSRSTQLGTFPTCFCEI